MIIRYFADIRKLAGLEQHDVETAAPTLRALLRELSAQHGAPFEQRVFERDGLSSTLIVFVNGRNIEHLNGIETPLRPDDVVSIFPMVAGG